MLTFYNKKKSNAKPVLIIAGSAVLVVSLLLFLYNYIRNDDLFLSRLSEHQASADENTAEDEQYEPEPEPTMMPVVAVTGENEFTVQKAQVELYEYEGDVEHIFFHPVVAYPELAFDGDYMAQGFDDWFVTVSEFNKIIQSIYDRDYILVKYSDFIEFDQDGMIKRKPLMLPEGKKPLIISIDDANYYQYMRENGVVHKLVIDEYGDVAAWTPNDSPELEVTRDNDIIPLLDDFIKLNPDFSHNGMKAYLSITGYEGVFGYPTNSKTDEAERRQAISDAEKVILQLKKTGWEFACHSYMHYGASILSYEKLEEDTRKWLDEVASLVGATNIYIYPFGDMLKRSDSKLEMLKENGFRIFAGVGPDAYYNFDDTTLFTQRRRVDGLGLRVQKDLNTIFYDADAVADAQARGWLSQDTDDAAADDASSEWTP